MYKLAKELTEDEFILFKDLGLPVKSTWTPWEVGTRVNFTGTSLKNYFYLVEKIKDFDEKEENNS